MEEEGIYYYFKHTESAINSSSPTRRKRHRRRAGQHEIIYNSLPHDWHDHRGSHLPVRQASGLTPGKYTLWDHSFELPHKHLEAEKAIAETAQVGQVTHKLNVGNNGKLEVYDYPGAYAQRFDGIDPGGGDRRGDLQNIFEDNERTVGIRCRRRRCRRS